MTAQWRNANNLQERICVVGELVLDTPTHLGNGDVEGLLDMPLHVDILEGRALLTGASLAGALRAYAAQLDSTVANQLFGEVRTLGGAPESVESRVIVDDALGQAPEMELRDGVAIDPITRTAEDKKKFDIELLTAGSTFPIALELLVRHGDGRRLLDLFAAALQALEEGQIRLGKRKRRGFGQCHVRGWQVQRFDVGTVHGMLEWLNYVPPKVQEIDLQSSVQTLLGAQSVAAMGTPRCILEGRFALEGSLLIRSGGNEQQAADTVHLRSRRGKRDVPILSGTSLAGTLRARALRIANTLGKPGAEIVDRLFGYRPKNPEDKTPMTASRLWVAEAVIQEPIDLVQTRVKLDRFTGGSFPGALFSEQAVFAGKSTHVQLRIELSEPTDSDVGLLLLLLKDLWTGDLPLGGESSIGRGRLRGETARLTYGAGGAWDFQLTADGGLQLDADHARLQEYVQAFLEQR